MTVFDNFNMFKIALIQAILIFVCVSYFQNYMHVYN